jgi:hypothetical protein
LDAIEHPQAAEMNAKTIIAETMDIRRNISRLSFINDPVTRTISKALILLKGEREPSGWLSDRARRNDESR